MNAAPLLSVVMPARDEERWIERSIRSVLGQGYPPDRLEVLVALGPSRDRTREIVAKIADADPRVRIVDNPSGATPRSLNLGIAHARGEYIARVDCHGWLGDGYLEAAVDALRRTGVDAVGGVVEFVGYGPWGRAIAQAMGSRLGAGTAAFRGASSETEADGIMWGVWPRELFERLGGFDEALLRNQDDELCFRIIQAGGRILVTPQMRFSHVARGSLRGLARQYWQWGSFRAATMLKHRRPATPRQVVPPSIAGVVGVSTAVLACSRGRSRIARFVLGGYLCGVATAGGVVAWSRGQRSSSPLVAAAIAVMQLGYGGGFIYRLGAVASRLLQRREGLDVREAQPLEDVGEQPISVG